MGYLYTEAVNVLKGKTEITDSVNALGDKVEAALKKFSAKPPFRYQADGEGTADFIITASQTKFSLKDFQDLSNKVTAAIKSVSSKIEIEGIYVINGYDSNSVGSYSKYHQIQISIMLWTS